MIDIRLIFKYPNTLKVSREREMSIALAQLFVEAAVVGIVCIIFLILMVVAGIRQILKDRE